MKIYFGKSNATRLTPFLAGAGLAAILALTPALAGAQGATVLPLFRGDDAKAAGIQLTSWGSGSVTEDNKVLYGGSESLRLVTHGLYQGASLTFTNPVDLGPYFTDKSAYLQFVILPPADPNAAGGGGGGSSYPGGPGPGKGGGLSGGPGFPGSPGGPPGAGRGGYSGGSPGAGGRGGEGTASSIKFQKPHAMENIRVLLITGSGKALEMLIPMNYAVDDNQWKLLNYPISVIPGLKADDAQIKEIRIFGDVSGTMYVGKIGVVTDVNKITIDTQDEKIVNPNVKYRYNVSAKGGITPLQYSWDWDDRDGIQDESQGRSVTHTFRKSGDYKVTVTVKDPFGVKTASTMKFNVHVP